MMWQDVLPTIELAKRMCSSPRLKNPTECPAVIVSVVLAPAPLVGVAEVTNGPDLTGAPGTVQLPNCRKSVHTPVTSLDWMNVPIVCDTSVGLNVTGTVTIM